MAAIAIIDDDLAMELVAENLANMGHDVRRYPTTQAATEDLDRIARSDLVFIDLVMDAPAGVSGQRHGGMWLYRELRKTAPTLHLIVFSAISDPDVINVIERDPHAQFCAKWAAPRLSEIVEVAQRALGQEVVTPGPQVFIVHGHDDATKLAVKNYLQNTLGLPEPTILHEQPNAGRTLIEKLEYYVAESTLAFVLLTPDDKVESAGDSNLERRRARQNVIFELGLFLGTLGRQSGRVILLHKGPIELPSDIQGLIYIDISNGVEAAGEKIRKELRHVLAA